MTLDEIVAWYQKKIGTCDKQQWEKTVEQKILDGFGGVTLKTARLKTEFIDVDLVRGSTFPKAKPKQSLVTVIRFAILRYFLLPVYAKWWVRQTSPNVFAILLFLYVTQMVNIALYTFNIYRLEHDASVVETYSNDTESSSQEVEQQMVSLTQLLIPMALSLLLSLIHSQIVATNSASGSKSKQRRRVANSSSQTNGKQHSSQQKEATRVRRRKKLIDFNRIRNQQYAEASQRRNRQSGVEDLSKAKPENDVCSEINQVLKSCCAPLTANNTTSNNIPLSQKQRPATPLTLDLNTDSSTPTDSVSNQNHSNANFIQKKRNVNWHSPLHNYASFTLDHQQQFTEQELFSGTANKIRSPKRNSPDDNSSSSTITSQRIEESVQEFYNDLIRRTATPQPVQQNNSGNNEVPRRNICEDDGFESLNGKSSSGEDNTNSNSLPPTVSSAPVNLLRLRLNAGTIDEPKVQPNAVFRRKVPLSSDSDTTNIRTTDKISDTFSQAQKNVIPSSDDTDADDGNDDDAGISSPASFGNNSNNNECTTSATEWLGVTTNSEECSYSSELENSDGYKNHQHSDEESNDLDFTPATILNAHGSIDRISCTIWDQREIKKAQMSVLEISSCIIERVESMPETNDYIYIGVFFSFLLSLIPTFCRLCEITVDADKTSEISYLEMPMILWEKAAFSLPTIFRFAFGNYPWERTILIIGLIQRLFLTQILFIIFAVAERTFKQRFLYAKLFSHLTSSRRARKSNLPHFRLNKVRNIKTWLSVRSYLKKRGPQRSVDVIVSAAFIVTLLLLAFLSVEWLKDSVHLHSHLNLEALMWSTMIGIFLLRFMTLGNKIHEKYRSISVLITEQINLYLQIEQKPKKKDELMVSNSVLKLAADLLKELESPFKISGLSANPYLFTTIKVVILSALSGVLSEILGFKLKLHKIKIK